MGTLSRALLLFTSGPFLARLGYGLSWQNAVILCWGSLRGAVGLALALQVALDYQHVGNKVSDTFFNKFFDSLMVWWISYSSAEKTISCCFSFFIMPHFCLSRSYCTQRALLYLHYFSMQRQWRICSSCWEWARYRTPEKFQWQMPWSVCKTRQQELSRCCAPIAFLPMHTGS